MSAPSPLAATLPPSPPLAAAAVEPVPAYRAVPLGARLRRHAWLLLLPFAFVAYAASFAGVPVIERRHSVLGDADAANFAVLLRDFRLGHRYGNEYAAQHRGLGDNAQKHKIHHVLYAAVGGAAYRAAAPVYRIFGLDERMALYAVNALVTLANLLLLAALLRRVNPHGNPAAPFLLFHAAALSTWVFGSVPESWPFSATLVLGYLLLLRRKQVSPPWMGALLGVVMLNNVFLAALGVLLAVALFAETGGWRGARRTALAALASVATWAGGLAFLSLWDASFRPDRFIRFTLWFKQFTGADLPRTDPYVWKSAATNLYVNSVAGSQPDPAVPQEALLATLRGGGLGLAATLAWVALAAAAAFLLARQARRMLREGGVRAAAADGGVQAALWCAVMLGVTVVLFYPSGFLYSTVVVPPMAVVLCRALDLRMGWQRWLLYATLALMAVVNLGEVLRFRAALMAMS
ncbi:MAG TPA: hypothetical protein VFJ16_09670 [Longimicrobium sp.]|nr:hypothetical protein [Longimicrobium sp.]